MATIAIVMLVVTVTIVSILVFTVASTKDILGIGPVAWGIFLISSVVIIIAFIERMAILNSLTATLTFLKEMASLVRRAVTSFFVSTIAT